MRLQEFAQIFPLHIIHDKILATRGFDKVIGDTRQVGVGEAGQHDSLTLELGLGLW